MPLEKAYPDPQVKVSYGIGLLIAGSFISDPTNRMEAMLIFP